MQILGTAIASRPFRFDGHDEAKGPLTMNDLLKHRSMLMILIAACSTARTAFEAADNVVDKDLLADLDAMIKRSELELEKLTERIEAA